ncbi:MAG: ABC transporter ATP-binding protein [Acidobacteriota bacterium]|nr:ABC transporter ATP-binding protein [Acidobacteriota bacterium]
MPALEILGLEKSYQVGFLRKTEKVALKPFQLAVEEGEIFGYLGPNGAGKTTTLKLLLGLVFPTAGSARLLGRDWRDADTKADIGFLPEQPYFYDYLTATELLDYYGHLSGMDHAARRKRVPEVLDRVGMSAAAHIQLRKFSKGMLQRVGIAQAIVHDPKLVILDEPMSGLDPMGRLQVRDLIQSLKDEGKTVFFSTHILSDAETLCDRVAVLNQGELRAVGVVADLTAEVGGKVEVVWQGTKAVPAIAALGGECRMTASLVRATLPEAQLDAAIDAIRRAQERLVSVTPVRATLEDYFLQKLGQPPADATEAQP